MALTKSFWTPTTWEANNRPPATVKQRKPLIPTIASRCFWRSTSGSPRRHASMNRYAQPIAASISTIRTMPSTTVLLSNQKTNESKTIPSPKSTTTVAISPNQIRRAIRPVCFRPATICAEPGSTSVMNISISARRNWAPSVACPRAVRGARSGGSGVRTGAMGEEDLSRSRGGQSVPPSITSHTRRAGDGAPSGLSTGSPLPSAAPFVDLGLAGQPMGAPDLGLAHPAYLLGGLRCQRRDLARAPLGVDGHEDEVRRGDVHGVGPGLVPRLRLDAYAVLHRRASGPVDLGRRAQDVTYVHG